MSKHRTTKTHHRKMVVAAVAVAAVGVPSVAMACLNGPGDKGDEARGVETSASAGQEHGQRWHEKKSHHWDAEKAEKTASANRAKKAKGAARASRSSSATPRAHTTGAPATTLSATAPAAAKSKAPATTAPATKAAASPSSAAAGAEEQVVELVNSERAKVGCSPVKVNAKLTAAAEAHSKDMAEHSDMSHTGSDGSSPGDRIEKAGYSWSTYGENVAYGYSSAKSVMEGWMNSSGHKANILNCDFKEIGVGLAQHGDYWTQDFGTAR
ncbi:CAP domain-containing protein [Streptomyces sp. NPDC021212]|uniref:CAP domain-containing protein n=1 Tax=Streptomyces sp. NPDC021212 TaxID=3365118 RepID=UPI00379AAA52